MIWLPKLQELALLGDASAAVVLFLLLWDNIKSRRQELQREFREQLRARRDWVSDYQSGDKTGRLAFMQRLKRLSDALEESVSEDERRECLDKACLDLQLRQYCFLMGDIKATISRLPRAERLGAERKLKGTLHVERELLICDLIEGHL